MHESTDERRRTREVTGPQTAKRQRVEERSCPDQAETSFWDEVGSPEPSSNSDPLLTGTLTQNSRGDLILKDARLSELLGKKTGPIMKITGASQLTLKGNRLYIGGGPIVQEAVRMYADIVVRAMVSAQYEGCNLVRLYVSEEFAESFGSKEAKTIEEHEAVLIVTERRQDTGIDFRAGDFVEVQAQHGLWRLATVARVPASQFILARSCSDRQEQNVALRRVRRARSIAIFGKAPNRLAAALRIASMFEKVAAGALACLQENPFFQGRLIGVISEELQVRLDVVERLQKSPYLTNVKNATGCSIMLFSRPASDKSSKATSVPHVLVAGALEERWKGLQIVKTLAAGMHERRHPALPRSLSHDSRIVKIPKDLLSVVVGKNMSAVMEMMRSTTTVIVPLRENDDKAMELLDTLVLEEDAAAKSCEIAVLGEPLARAIAELKIRALVEKHNPGYAEQMQQEDRAVSNPLSYETFWIEGLERFKGGFRSLFRSVHRPVFRSVFRSVPFLVPLHSAFRSVFRSAFHCIPGSVPFRFGLGPTISPPSRDKNPKLQLLGTSFVH